MKIKIILLFARSWSMTDENTKQLRSGVSIQYVMNGTLTPVRGENGDKGIQVVKESITNECAAGIVEAPGYYEAEMGLKAQGGKNVLYVNKLKYIGPLEK